MSRVRVRVLFEPRDLWVGVYVKPTYTEAWMRVTTLFVCILPTLPIRIEFTRGRP